MLGSKYFSTLLQQSKHYSFEEALKLLNLLPTKSSVLHRASREISAPPLEKYKNTILATEKYLIRSGMCFSDLDKLSVIHVSGTKGKGSTCAFTESILRHHGIKTGFFSSPHLVSVRERIRIQGVPIEKSLFTRYFFLVYEKLDMNKEHELDMPHYFQFLTILSMHIFCNEKVEVAVVEVGIGGEYDCTNIVRNVPVVGITSLGMDHISLLGSTIEDIAWNKAGIMKQNCLAYTVSQPESAMSVLKERSIEKKCTLNQISYFSSDQIGPNFVCGVPSDVQMINASLAIYLAHTWINLNGGDYGMDSKSALPSQTRKGLENCIWLGRFQKIEKSGAVYFLDGAHTVESIELCAKWFTEETKRTDFTRVLIFNVTGNRNYKPLFEILQDCKFDKVFFAPNKPNDIVDYVELCLGMKQVWESLRKGDNASQLVVVVPRIIDVLNMLNFNKPHYILITGSLHLVGDALGILDESLND